MSLPRARRFCFTLNNPSDEHHLELVDLAVSCPTVRYLVYQVERAPTSGTEHIQGYIELRDPLRFKAIVDLLPAGAHVESARASAKQNVLYCTKADTRANGPYEFGTPSFREQGRRSDLLDTVAALAKSRSLLEAIDGDEAKEACYAKYSRGLQALASLKGKALRPPQPIRKKRVVCLWGPTGTGKTHTAYTSLQAAYPDEEPFIVPDNSGRWFDGYHGQSGVIFDDFRAEDDHMPVSLFLRITDQYPISVPIKGGFQPWKPEVIYLTSNRHPATFYSDQDPRTQAAVQRRLTEVSELTQPWTDDAKNPE